MYYSTVSFKMWKANVVGVNPPLPPPRARKIDPRSRNGHSPNLLAYSHRNCRTLPSFIMNDLRVYLPPRSITKLWYTSCTLLGTNNPTERRSPIEHRTTRCTHVIHVHFQGFLHLLISFRTFVSFNAKMMQYPSRHQIGPHLVII